MQGRDQLEDCRHMRKKNIENGFWGSSLWTASVQVRDDWWDVVNKETNLLIL
jgi:hypothetical protein